MPPLIVDIKRNSLDDGPGIRTVIFFKGCPLSCVWCQNPETKSPKQEISFTQDNCIECKSCVEVCNQNAIKLSNKYHINRDICNLCGECVEACQSEAIKFAGEEYTVNDLVTIILKDKTFFINSGGGVTFTGGEPTFHMDFLSELLQQLQQQNIHTCLETCGYYNRDKFDDLIRPYIDLIYFDLKIFDEKLHKSYCKISNKLILTNFESLIKEKDVKILPRIPLIPKITATKENLTQLANYLKSKNVKEIGLLPYNPLWLSKMDMIGVKAEYSRKDWMSKKEKQRVKEIFSDFEFRDF